MIEELNDRVGINPKNFEDEHGSYGCGDGNKEGERILDFCVAMTMTVGNTLFKKKGKSFMCLVHQNSGRLLFGKEKPKM